MRGDDTTLLETVGADAELIVADGSARLQSAEDTFGGIHCAIERAGITRLADVTGLDVVGIPTWQAIRPLAITLSVSQGKGCTPVQARVSAAMESIEQATWERFSPPPRWETLSGMRGERFISPAELADAVYGPVSVDTVLPWIDVRDIVSGAVFWVPHDTICVQRLGSYRKAARWAYASTNGLASGNSIGEACLHGLLEVIERDAETCADHLMEHEAVPRPRIDTATFGAPYVKELIEKVNSAGLGLLIFSNENPFAICCYSAYLEDRDTLFHTNVGHGAHLDPNVAAARAITEAAQGRITMISGTREDNARADYRVLHEVGESLLRRGRYEAELAGATVPAAAPMTLPRRLHGMLAIVVDRLRSEGFTRILQREITDEKIGVPVVKVLVPGLSGYHRPLAQRMESYRAWKSSVARA